MGAVQKNQSTSVSKRRPRQAQVVLICPYSQAEKTSGTNNQEWALALNPSSDVNGSPEIRTQDQSVKSRVLYR
jgi:hypothetical protein